MAHSHNDVAYAWVAHHLSGRSTRLKRNERMMPNHNGEQLYSYGSHFTLVRTLRDKDDELTGFLMNGDTYSPSTSRHQSEVRAAVQNRGVTSVIVPFSALAAAGIDDGEVEIVHVTADTIQTWEEVHWELPRNAILEWVPVEGKVSLEVEELYELVDEHNAKRLKEWQANQASCRRELAELVLDEKGWRRPDTKFSRSLWLDDHWLEKKPEPISLAGWLRKQWVRGRLDSHWDNPTLKTIVTHHRLACWVDGRKSREWDIVYDGDKTRYSREHRRHWLGESLLRAPVRWTQWHRCPACRRRPVQGPVHRVTHERWDTDVILGEGANRWKDATSYEYSYTELTDLEPPECERCRGHGQVLRNHRRTAYFLSGFDHNETRMSYFFAELPQGFHPTTVDEAYEVLKPDTVRLAEMLGREVKRQGDIFAIPAPTINRTKLRKSGAAIGKMLPLLNTNHCATEVAHLDGLTYARGILHHQPAGRRPDHARCRLGNDWHVVLKNTVPISA